VRTKAEHITGIVPDPLDLPAAIAAVGTDEAGGIGVFVGTVRTTAAGASHSNERVVRLDYDVHRELAERRLEEIARDAASKWGLLKVVALHRSGACELGEPTVVVACSAPHRAEALDACRWIIDELKATVPIFKREVYESGSSWVGAEADV
jgi:molybdopterin synthase catalytic subunit